MSTSTAAAPSPPGVPLQSDVTGRSCKLTWDVPRDDGGSPIINYIVERRAGQYQKPFTPSDTAAGNTH